MTRDWEKMIELGRVTKPSEIYRGCGLRWWKEAQPWREYPHRHQRMLTTTEAHYIYRLAKELGAGNYLNLGVFRGTSMACMAYGLQAIKAEGKVYGIDYFTYVPDMEKDVNEGMAATGLTGYIELCKGSTKEWAPKLKHLRFNATLIDADHSYEATKLDWELYSPISKVMIFHDCDLGSVDKVISEINSRWELIDHYWRLKAFRKKT